ncbi:unnamed protein product [Enterobius vermicularis]|uniref:Selenide, water dikinase n=1 Tax=Enterobius vermicularis TaxID=51028 RepID=A0A0N4V2R0_ENTVE|nr:unnamed protein product [Enterobius vermicularis]
MNKEIIKRILEGFDPVKHNLPVDFLLTNLTELKGCGCKVAQEVMFKFPAFWLPVLFLGIGLDSCIIPLRHEGLWLVQTTDFFYPLVDDPFLMGRITCANVLSDLYACGVSICDNMLTLLGIPRDMDVKVREIVIAMFLDGFKQTAAEVGTTIRGGQTVKCPWLLLGGVGTAVCSRKDMSKLQDAQPGDKIVLTKPVGGQVAVNSFEWLKRNNPKVKDLNLDEKKIRRAYQQTVEQMCRLNRNAAELARKYHAHASTDVTGFGLIGHADNLAKSQRRNCKFVIEKMPVIEYTEEISRKMGNGFRLYDGRAAETSGGLLIVVEEKDAEPLCKELEKLDGFPAWIIGTVAERTGDGDTYAEFSKNLEIFTVPSRIHS